MKSGTATIAMTVLFAAAHCALALGQSTPVTILQIDVENQVQYHEDVADFSKFATDPKVTTPVLPNNFSMFLIVGDIVAVNGRRAKGTFTMHGRMVRLTPTPSPGQAISDTVRPSVISTNFEIQLADGTPVGSIFAQGLGPGPAPPGSPLAVTQGNNAIVGGTGAFLGARGQEGQTQIATTTAARA